MTTDSLRLFQDFTRSRFIFVLGNPASGGNAAAALLEGQSNYLEFEEDDSSATGDTIKIVISDIRKGPSGDKDCFRLIRSLVDQKYADPVRIIVAGGDGTVTWVFSELKQHNIDLAKVYVGAVPFGTGNDFARATNAPQFGPETDRIVRLARQWIRMKPRPLDLWNVTVSLHPNSEILRIDPTTRKKVSSTSQPTLCSARFFRPTARLLPPCR